MFTLSTYRKDTHFRAMVRLSFLSSCLPATCAFLFFAATAQAHATCEDECYKEFDKGINVIKIAATELSAARVIILLDKNDKYLDDCKALCEAVPSTSSSSSASSATEETH